jgi:hypothetical protein
MMTSQLELTIGKTGGGMDWLQWSSSVIGSLAWPIAFIAFCLIFRAPLTRLIDKLKKASFAGGAIETTLDEGESRAEVAEAIAPPDRWQKAAAAGMAIDEMPPSLSPEHQTRRATEELQVQTTIDQDPAHAVQQIWRHVEAAVREAAKRKGATAEELTKPVYILSKHMNGQELFTSQVMEMLSDLRRVRNLANHSREEVTPEAAQRYFRLAVRLINLLEIL